ncbi:MAG: type II toxin-antitoxin system RelE/ParE family toxin [Luteolibacter sp.]
MRILFHSLALEDVREIVTPLDAESLQAADGFLSELRKAGALLASHPGMGHPAGPFRRWNLGRWPYHLLYLERPDDGEIWIMVVRHQARHPRHGLSRRLPEP